MRVAEVHVQVPNENNNGRLRHYLPRSLDFGTVTIRQLDAIATEFNDLPAAQLAG